MAKRVVIIGGVAAGPKIAAKLRRLDHEVEITIIEKGQFLSYAGCGLPYYICEDIKEQRELMETPVGVLRDPEFFEKTKNVKVYNRTEAIKVDRLKKEVEVKNLDTNQIKTLPYDYLVFATGAKVMIPPIKAVDIEHPGICLLYTSSRVKNIPIFQKAKYKGTMKNITTTGCIDYVNLVTWNMKGFFSDFSHTALFSLG